MPSEPPTEIAANSDPGDQSSGEDVGADGAAESGDRDDRSYEQRVMDRLVPDIGVGDADKPDTHEADGEPKTMLKRTPTPNSPTHLRRLMTIC